MSAAVKPEGSGGTDLSKLTNGERFLIGWLDNPIGPTYSSNSNPGVIAGGYSLNQSTHSGFLNLSLISSIGFQWAYSPAGSSGRASISCISSTTGSEIGFIHVPVGSDVYTMDVSSYSTYYLTNCYFWLSSGSVGLLNYGIKCVSFTTRDGKVHTAANLNY